MHSAEYIWYTQCTHSITASDMIQLLIGWSIIKSLVLTPDGMLNGTKIPIPKVGEQTSDNLA